MKKLLFLLFACFVFFQSDYPRIHASEQAKESAKPAYWLTLFRRWNQEFLYFGNPGETINSKIVKIFKVKPGAYSSPTPLPRLLFRDYWIITNKYATYDKLTSPYFLTLDIPVTDYRPYGPENYPECFGYCDWVISGKFGLHGIGGDKNKISSDDQGSYGCIRHYDEDITYLFNILDPENNEVRYYIEEG